MKRLRSHAVTRTRAERGIAAVEAALLTPFVFMIIFGIMEMGLYMKDAVSASAGVNQGVRVASAAARNSTYPELVANRLTQALGDTVPWEQVDEVWVYKANTSNPYPSGYSNFSDCSTCFKFVWDGTKLVQAAGPSWPASAQSACAGGTIDRVGVYVRIRHEYITSLFGSTPPSNATP